MTSPYSSTALAGKTIVLIGGGSGIGLQVARLVVGAGAQVILGGRSAERLKVAAADLGGHAVWKTVDTADQATIEEFFDYVNVVDGLFTTAASYTTGSMADTTLEEAASPFESKFWGQYRVVKQALPKLAPTASVVLMSGAASVRPAPNGATYAAANSAIEGLARGLAIELAPVRVNAIAPGTINGHLWANRSAEVREAAFAQMSADSVVGRPGTENEVAEAVMHLFLNSYITGSTLYADGGYSLR